MIVSKSAQNFLLNSRKPAKIDVVIFIILPILFGLVAACFRADLTLWKGFTKKLTVSRFSIIISVVLVLGLRLLLALAGHLYHKNLSLKEPPPLPLPPPSEAKIEIPIDCSFTIKKDDQITHLSKGKSLWLVPKNFRPGKGDIMEIKDNQVTFKNSDDEIWIEMNEEDVKWVRCSFTWDNDELTLSVEQPRQVEAYESDDKSSHSKL